MKIVPGINSNAPVSVMVFNLDAIEQTRLWLKVGPRRATEILVGALRTALLFGATVVVDRNQLLEGIFFVSVSPDRLAWHLGLEPGSKLPISIRLLPSPKSASKPPLGPWKLSEEEALWGVGEHELAQRVIDNYEAVADDPRRVSSPLIALIGTYDQGEGAISSARGASYISKGAAWEETDPVFMPQEIWSRRNAQVAYEMRKAGRTAWVDAMMSGRLNLIDSAPAGPNPIGPELEATRPASSDPLITELVNKLIAVEEPGRNAHICSAQHQGTSAGSNITSEPECGLKHATTRSLIVRWLDGEVVDELEPKSLSVNLTPEQRELHGPLALDWWVNAYYQAITRRDGYRLLTLSNTMSSESGLANKGREAPEEAWGLRCAPLTPWQRLRARFSSSVEKSVRIGGDVVEQLAGFTPDQYVRLQRFDVVGKDHLLRAPDNKHMFDLALAVNEISGDMSSRSRRIRGSMLRGLLILIPGVGLALVENDIITLSGPAWAAVIVGAAVALAIPWDTLQEITRMQGSSLQSTLRLRKD